MFRNRRSSQKPADNLYKEFKASWSGLKQEQVSGQASQQRAVDSDGDVAVDVQYVDGEDDIAIGSDDAFSTFPPQTDAQSHPIKDGEPTPRGHDSAWAFGVSGLTPSVLDPNSTSFDTFATQLPGYYTPTPGGSTLYHSHHAGDLHTPGFTFGLGTPLSLPTSADMMHAGQHGMSLHGLQPHQPISQAPMPHQLQFQGMDPFHLQQPHQFPSRPFDVNPPAMQHIDSTSTDTPSMADISMNMGIHDSPDLSFHPFPSAVPGRANLQHPLTERFRYHTTLNAATAMVKSNDEIPITYLNKGQTYTLNVQDTAPQHSTVGQLKYRTFVRISFEDPDQRSRPGACWQLWKEGRGTNEAHHRGGRLQAVEHVDTNTGGSGNNDGGRPVIELESASFDGFCVTWTPAPDGKIECPILLRFNFLSTDFSHSKGVKGIPVRLCAKTELLLDSMSPTAGPTHEICFCKVKLFRDHGAERKLSNDIAHVKKSIEKLNQQIAQMEAGAKDSGKRKRSNAGQETARPGKIPKHRRTWSMSSNNGQGGKLSAEDELQSKLDALQQMFSSTRPSSILFLRGTDEDDMDLHPVRLSGEPTDLTKIDTGDAQKWDRQSIHSSTMVSPTPSSQSMPSRNRRDSTFQSVATVSRIASNEWKQPGMMDNMDSRTSTNVTSPVQKPSKVKTLASPSTGVLGGWIDSVGVDPSYHPPPERIIKPVACFHVRIRISGQVAVDEYYRAIYLMQRTLKDINTAVCIKAGVEPTLISRVLRINKAGTSILLSDADVVELPEGQDMTALFQPTDDTSSPVRSSRQWDNEANEIQCDGEVPVVHDMSTSRYELRLFY